MVIDHINGDTLDNRLENLRCITQELNCRNREMRWDNKHGVTGLSWRAPCPSSPAGAWVATFKGKSIKRNVSTYGYDEARQLVLAWRQQQLQDDPTFTERHGK